MPKLHIALNVTRTRVTILSFILAIDLFTFGILANLELVKVLRSSGSLCPRASRSF